MAVYDENEIKMVLKKVIEVMYNDAKYEKKNLYKSNVILKGIEDYYYEYKKTLKDEDKDKDNILFEELIPYISEYEYEKIINNKFESYIYSADLVKKVILKVDKEDIKNKNVIDEKKNLKGDDCVDEKFIIKFNKNNYKKIKKIDTNKFYYSDKFTDYVCDYFWIETFGRELYKDEDYKDCIEKHVYANRFASKGSKHIFRPYFDNYKSFLENTTTEIRDNYDRRKKNKNEVIIFKLDLKHYYKNVNINGFQEIVKDKCNVILYEKINTDTLNFFENVNERIFNEIYKKKDINNGLYIGFEASKIIANLYGTYLDKLILSTNPTLYSRYVDDILITYTYKRDEDDIKYYINFDEKSKKYKKKFNDIEVTLGKNEDTDMVNKKYLNTFEYQLNYDKTRSIVITNDLTSIHLKTFENFLWRNSSDAFKLPDIYKVDDLSLLNINISYVTSNLSNDLNILVIKQVLGLIKYKIEFAFQMNNLDYLKNDRKLIDSIKNINSIIDDVLLIELSDYWYNMHLIDQEIGTFFDVKSRLKRLKIDEAVEFEKYYTELVTMKVDITKFLNKNIEFNHDCYKKQIIELSDYISTEQNYQYCKEENTNKYECTIDEKITDINKNCIQKYRKENKDNISKIIEDFNVLSDKYKNNKKTEYSVVLINDPGYNIDTYIDDMLTNKSVSIRFSEKEASIREISNLVTDKDDIILLPELYISLNQLDMYCKISKRKECIIIGGMELIVIGNYVVNLLVTIIPLCTEDKKNKNVYIYFRPKIFMAPDEKKLITSKVNPITKKKYNYFEGKDSYIREFKISEYLTIASFNCFELYSIKLRSNLGQDTSLITLHESNKDLEVFDKLSRSLLTDYKAYVSQVNYSKYGDTGIFAPKKNFERDFVKFKGGQFFIAREKINVEELHRARNDEIFSIKNNYKPNPPEYLRSINDKENKD